MHRFSWYPLRRGGEAPCLQGAHLVGADGVAVRGDIRVDGDEIVCEMRNPEAAGLSLMWPVPGFGAVQLETTRVPPREKPYHLHVELARHRLMRISVKREEWGLYDYNGMNDVAAQIDRAHELFIASLKLLHDGPASARAADESLALALAASERMCRFHAGVFLSRRPQAGPGRSLLGATVSPAQAARAALVDRLRPAFDFARVPFVWRSIQPKEQGGDFEATDQAVKALAKAGLSVRGGALLNFSVQSLPDWLYLWENDYEAIADFAREHIRRTVQRYARQITNWIVASGLHAGGMVPLTFEQIIELTRMAASTAKQSAPRAQAVLELVQPWGEYYARNPRTVPPLLYAEMVVQSGISFDAFGLQLLFGTEQDGYHTRDLFQISSLLDRLANLGKPIHLTAVGVPSAARADDEFQALRCGGQWHGPWSEEVQADWLASVAEVALSKPYVESVCLHSPTDAHDAPVPAAGVLRDDLSPRAALARLIEFRKRLAPEAKR